VRERKYPVGFDGGRQRSATQLGYFQEYFKRGEALGVEAAQQVGHLFFGGKEVASGLCGFGASALDEQDAGSPVGLGQIRNVAVAYIIVG
jgi:hypothetical protein